MTRRLQPQTIAFVVLAGLIGAILAACGPESPASQALHWDRYDVTIDINQDGTFRVSEDQDISFDRGFFSQGFAVIPLGRIEEISNVQLLEDGQPYQRATSGGTPGTFTVRQFGGELDIRWYFDSVVGPETRNFTISYDIAGGLRVYDSPSINQIWWRAIDEDFTADIDSSTITINLPAEVPAPQLTAEIFTHAYPAESVQINQVDGDTVVFQAANIKQGNAIEPRVTFPQITLASEPSWQAADDARRAREERLEPLRALANVLFLGAGLMLAVGGPVGLYAIWHNYGRDKPVEIPIDVLREPPDDLPPGVVGTLVDERADIHDLIATMVDLAERDIIHIEEDNSEILGITTSRDWAVSKIGSFDGLTPSEKSLTNALFGRKSEIKLKEIRKSFGQKQGKVRKAYYEELVKRGYFPHNPDTIRSRWKIGGFVLLGAMAIIGIRLWSSIGNFAPFAIAVLIGLGILGAAIVIASRWMPRKTPKGAEAAARWVAFRRYLEQIEQYGDLQEAKDIFARYLPYAVAFGIEKSWVRKFSRVDTPAPRWYGPRAGRNWRTGRGRPVIVGDGGGLDMPGMPSLNDMSGGMTSSLQGMSNRPLRDVQPGFILIPPLLQLRLRAFRRRVQRWRLLRRGRRRR